MNKPVAADGDFLSHQCKFCKPLSINLAGGETLPAYAEPMRGVPGEYQLLVWCRYCWCFHKHLGGIDPLKGTGNGHREPHCSSEDELGRYDQQYELKCVGFITEEILQLHKASQRIRSKYVKAIREAVQRKNENKESLEIGNA